MRVLLIWVSLFYSLSGQAQEAKSKNENLKQNSIRVGPLSIAFFSLDMKYERYLNKHSSLQLGLIQVFDPLFFGESSWSGQIYTCGVQVFYI